MRRERFKAPFEEKKHCRIQTGNIFQPEMYRINSMYSIHLPRLSLFLASNVWQLLNRKLQLESSFNNEALHLEIKSRANRIHGNN